MIIRGIFLFLGLMTGILHLQAQTSVSAVSCPWIVVTYSDGPDGIPVESLSFLNPPDGTYRIYADAAQSQLLMEGEFAAGLKQGEWRFFSNNILSEVITYLDNTKNGLYECYDQNGTLRVRTTFVNDLANGLYETWDASGQPLMIKQAVNGIISE